MTNDRKEIDVWWSQQNMAEIITTVKNTIRTTSLAANATPRDRQNGPSTVLKWVTGRPDTTYYSISNGEEARVRKRSTLRNVTFQCVLLQSRTESVFRYGSVG